ncbi:MAG: hypothetical protein Q9227_006292 [Pyrenula ochraceoflavens]
MFRRKDVTSSPSNTDGVADNNEKTSKRHHLLPTYNHNGHKVTPGIQPDGESGRKGIHPLKFLKICGRSTSRLSMAVNILWPFVPAAIAVAYARREAHVWIFALCYLAIIPAANLLGFAGQELARKLPRVFGVLLEVTIGSVVEIVLFMVLIKKDDSTGNFVPVIQAAILGSILTNLLLCLGLCFFVGGLRNEEQSFHEAVSEVGSGLLLVAAFALLIPSAFRATLRTLTDGLENLTPQQLDHNTRKISQAAAIILLVAFVVFMWFNARSNHSIFDEVLGTDEERDRDKHKDLVKSKLTFTECILAIAVSLALVSLLAVLLVEEIEFMVQDRGVPDAFMGLILVPLVEKAAEHLTAIDEAWDNQINFALFHCLGPSIQTALLNAPLVVLVGWGLGKPMDLGFDTFFVILLVLSILVVGNFLRDGKSNYLEGALLVFVYTLIAVAAFYYPNPNHGGEATAAESGAGAEGAL